MAATPGVTAGDWNWEPMDPGYSGSREEPPEPYYPATVYSMIPGIDGFEHCVPIANMEFPQYREYTDELGHQGYFDEPIESGDQDANARFMAASPSMWRALKAVRGAMLNTEGTPGWGGPWDGVFDAIDGAIKRAEGVEGFEEHDGRTERELPS